MAKTRSFYNIHTSFTWVALLTGCSVLGDFGAFEDEPTTDTSTEGDGDGDGDPSGGGAGDGDDASGGDENGDGDGDGDDGASGGRDSGDGDSGGSGNSASGGDNGDGDGDSGGNSGSGGAGDGSGGTGSGGALNGSDGCGATDHPISGTYTFDAGGTNRQYIIDVPDSYDPNTPFPLTIALHAYGDNAASIASGGYFDLEPLADDGMIFVAPQGNNDNWASSDVAVISALLDDLETKLCLDVDRIFAVGFSIGGVLTNMLGCALADRFRAIAPLSGAIILGCAEGDQPIAYIGFHGNADTVITPTSGRDARDEFVARNSCSSSTQVRGSNSCVEYQDCTAGYPVVWCEFTGDHFVPNYVAAEVWSFFSQF